MPLAGPGSGRKPRSTRRQFWDRVASPRALQNRGARTLTTYGCSSRDAASDGRSAADYAGSTGRRFAITGASHHQPSVRTERSCDRATVPARPQSADMHARSAEHTQRILITHHRSALITVAKETDCIRCQIVDYFLLTPGALRRGSVRRGSSSARTHGRTASLIAADPCVRSMIRPAYWS